MLPLLRAHGLQLPTDTILAAYARAEAAAEQGAYVSYREVLRRTFTGMAQDLGFAPRRDEVETLVRSLAEWEPFPDTVASLRKLATRYHLGIISNVDEDLFEATRARLGVPLDFVVTADAAHAYKPDRAPFELALRRAGHDASGLLHAAQSLYHDVAPARAMGIATVHVVREAGRDGVHAAPSSDADADWTVPDLRGLVDLLGLSNLTGEA
jgi:2-haloalkanoic acid dehalogenase type II